MSKSKLGHSLLHAIQKGDKSHTDPFEESKKTSPSFLQDTNSDATELEEEFDIVSNEDPIELKSKKLRKPDGRWKLNGVGVAASIAVAISFFSVTLSSYAIRSQDRIEELSKNGIEYLENAVGTLTSRTDELAADLNGAKRTIEENSASAGRLETVISEIEGVKVAISNIKSEMLEARSALDDQKNALALQKAQVRELEVRNVEITKAAKASPKASPKKAYVEQSKDHTSLEGAIVASIDTWGAQPYVMLRESDGDWVPLTMGDLYKGWRFTGAISSDGALFKKGNKTKKLKVDQ